MRPKIYHRHPRGFANECVMVLATTHALKWLVRDHGDENLYTVETTDGKSRSILAEVRECWIAPEHGMPSAKDLALTICASLQAHAQLRADLQTALEALYTALPYIEAAEDDPLYVPGHVRKVTAEIRAAIAKIKAHNG